MTPRTLARGALRRSTLGSEWLTLTDREREHVAADFADMLQDEYDTPDPTCPDGIALENAETAAREYCRRIGHGHLASYAACLIALEDNA